MEDYASNSKCKKGNTNSEDTTDKDIKSVAKGKVKKKSELGKLSKSLISENVGDLKSYVLNDVLIPAIKKGLYDVVTNGIDLILYGEVGHSKNKKGSYTKVSYDGYYSRGRDRDRDRDRDKRRSVDRDSFDYDELVFDSRGEVELVLTTMDSVLDKYSYVTVADLYDMADVKCSEYTANDYGWTDLRSAQPVRLRDGWGIKLPRPMPIDKR